MRHRRNYAAIERGLLDHDKWEGLTWEERGKWLAVRLLAEPLGGEFSSRRQAERMLRKEGDVLAAETISKLLEVGLLDETDDGLILIHDWEEWRPDTSAERTRAWRERQRHKVDNSVDNRHDTLSDSGERHETSQRVTESHTVTGTDRGEESRGEREPPPTPSQGGRVNGSNPRALGTNPRSVAAFAREERKRQDRAELRREQDRLAEASSVIDFREAMKVNGLQLDTDNPKASR